MIGISMNNSPLPRILFVTIFHQYKNFLACHCDYVKKNNIFISNYIIIDKAIKANKYKRNSVTFIFIQYLKFIKILNKEKNIDLIVSSHPLSGLFMAVYLFTNPSMRVYWIHWFTGQVWATEFGLKRWIYKHIDKFICKKANYIFCDSNAQVKFLKKNGFEKFQKFIAPGLGSINGVPKILFIDQAKKINRKNIRLGFVGRISQDKGILRLINEFANWKEPNFSLEVYGEIDDPKIKNKFIDLVSRIPKVNYYGSISDKRLIYSNIDILIQPSLREGFSNVLIEAQAQCIPVVVRDIYGVKDAYINNVTGITFKNDSEILGCIKSIIIDDNIFRYFQVHARKFAANFLNNDVLKKISDEYISCIKD